jgi:hypothetical protein
MRLFLLTVSAATVAALLPTVASADRVYHSEHLRLTPMNGAPLRSGFVENIKAEGPMVYAHEIFVLNGAQSGATYSVTRDFYLGPVCAGDVFHLPVTTLTTNASGNARGSVVVRPADVVGFEGDHGVMWTLRDAEDEIAYQTSCTTVHLD